MAYFLICMLGGWSYLVYVAAPRFLSFQTLLSELSLFVVVLANVEHSTHISDLAIGLVPVGSNVEYNRALQPIIHCPAVEYQGIQLRQKIQLLIINPRNADAETDDEDTILDGQPNRRMERIKLLGVQMDNNLNLLVT